LINARALLRQQLLFNIELKADYPPFLWTQKRVILNKQVTLQYLFIVGFALYFCYDARPF